MSETMLTDGAGLGITYGAIALFAIVASVAMPFVYKRMKTDSEAGANGSDFWYSARNSEGWLSLGLSFFASSMGAWVIFAAPEVGALQGWWGVIGYAIGSTFPFVVLAVLGPLIRSRFAKGFCLMDWVHDRFGRATQVYISLISVLYMWVYLVAELTSMGNLIRDFTGLDPLHALLPMSLVTMLYTMAAGLPASIWTDRLQGVMMLVVIAVAVGACLSDVKVQEKQWKEVAVWNDKGFETFITLTLAILGAELMNMGGWQRVYAAKNEAELRKGTAFGSVLIFLTMLLFGMVGMLAEAQDRGRAEPQLALKFLAFFDLLGAQPTWVKGMTYAFATCMVASSVDSLQTGLVSIVSKDVQTKKLSPLFAMIVGQLFVLAVNVPAIIMAAEATKDAMLGINIINLFLVADLLAASVTVPVFMGLGTLATQTGVLSGCFAGLLVILAFGWFEFGTFMAGLEMMTLMTFGNIQPVETGLGASRTCILFFVLPVVTGSVSFVVSWMERTLERLTKVTSTYEAIIMKETEGKGIGKNDMDI